MERSSSNNNQNQPWWGRINNDNNSHNMRDEQSEEKDQYGQQNPVINRDNLTARSALQLNLIERMYAEERLQLHQQNQQMLQLAQNQQLFQLAQNQSPRRQTPQQQNSELQCACGANAVSAAVTFRPASGESAPRNRSQLHLEQQSDRELDHLRERHQNLLQLQLLREQRMRQEAELLEEILLVERRQESLFGHETGMNNSNSSVDARLSNSRFVQPTFDRAAALPRSHSNPDNNFARGHLHEGEVLLNQIRQSQFIEPSSLNSNRQISNMESLMGRDQDSNPFAAIINTAPADNTGSLTGIDLSRVETAVQRVARHFPGIVQGDVDYIDSVQGSSLSPSINSTSAARNYQPIVNTMKPDGDVAKKVVEKKKPPSRKKVAGMPKRPLHAYNIYFQEERRKMLKEIPSPSDYKAEEGMTPGARRKRRRRGTHGKISFASLAKEIGYKWKNLSKERKEHYQQLAEIELNRYDDEMDAYNLMKKDKEAEGGIQEHQDESLEDRKPKAKDDNHKDDNDAEENGTDTDDDDDDTLSITAVSAKKRDV